MSIIKEFIIWLTDLLCISNWNHKADRLFTFDTQ